MKIFKKIEVEIKNLFENFLNDLDEHLLPYTNSNETIIFYLNMKAFIYRSMTEFPTIFDSKEAIEKSLMTYREAHRIACVNLSPIDSMRLNISLNFSVFYYEILNFVDEACRLSKKAFDDAIKELHNLHCREEETNKDTYLLMHLLRDNLTLWSSDLHGKFLKFLH